MKNIPIIGVTHYSMDTEGRVFLGAQEITGFRADPITVIFPLMPRGCKYQRPYALDKLFRATFGRVPPARIYNRYANAPKTEYSLITLTGVRGTATFTTAMLAMEFLKIDHRALLRAIKFGLRVNGFKVTGS